MDPKSSFMLDIHLKANPRKCRKDSCYRFSKVVDSDMCNFKDFVGEIMDQYPHGFQEVVHVFYYDDFQKYVEVRTYQELLAMFSKHVDNKKVRMTITYTEPTDVPIIECIHPEISARLDIPCTPSVACPSFAAPSQSTQPSSKPITFELFSSSGSTLSFLVIHYRTSSCFLTFPIVFFVSVVPNWCANFHAILPSIFGRLCLLYFLSKDKADIWLYM